MRIRPTALMSQLLLGFVLIGILSALQAQAALRPSSQPSQQTVYMCKNRKIVRTLRTASATSDNECHAIYTKAGIDKSVGTGRNSATCKRFVDNVRGNLVRAGWNCRDVSRRSKITAAPGQE